MEDAAERAVDHVGRWTRDGVNRTFGNQTTTGADPRGQVLHGTREARRLLHQQALEKAVRTQKGRSSARTGAARKKGEVGGRRRAIKQRRSRCEVVNNLLKRQLRRVTPKKKTLRPL